VAVEGRELTLKKAKKNRPVTQQQREKMAFYMPTAKYNNKGISLLYLV